MRILNQVFRSAAALLAASLVMLAAAPSAFAHPHVFIECEVGVLFDDSGVSGLRQTWFFDEMFSTIILEDFDTDQDGALSPAEIKGVRDGAFANLKNYSYFTHLTLDGAAMSVAGVRDFTAGVRDGMLFYTFTVICPVQATDTERTLVFTPFDPEYYADIYLEGDEVVHFENAGAFEVGKGVAANPGAIFSVYNAVPYEVTLTLKRKG